MREAEWKPRTWLFSENSKPLIVAFPLEVKQTGKKTYSYLKFPNNIWDSVEKPG